MSNSDDLLKKLEELQKQNKETRILDDTVNGGLRQSIGG
jgi:hypothetical protein